MEHKGFGVLIICLRPPKSGKRFAWKKILNSCRTSSKLVEQLIYSNIESRPSEIIIKKNKNWEDINTTDKIAMKPRKTVRMAEVSPAVGGGRPCGGAPALCCCGSMAFF